MRSNRGMMIAALMLAAGVIGAVAPTSRAPREATGAAGATSQAPEQAAGDAELIARADAARTWGSDPSLPTIDEFVDMACSDCADFHMERGDSLLSRIVAGGRANYVVRIYPIPRLMRGYHAAEALLTAGAVGGKLFNSPAPLYPAAAGTAGSRIYRFHRDSRWAGFGK